MYITSHLIHQLTIIRYYLLYLDHITKSKSSLKSKRVRTIFTPEQLERLEAEFERQQYMVGPERLYLAHTLQLTEAQVSPISFTFSIYHINLLILARVSNKVLSAQKYKEK